MKDPRHEVRPRPPAMFRVTWLVVDLALRRWTNRLNALRRWKVAPRARDATNRKRPAGHLLAAFVSVLLLLGGTTQTFQLVSRTAAVAQQRADVGAVVVSEETLAWVDSAERLKQCEGTGAAEDEQWRKGLRSAFSYEAYREGIRGDDDREARTEKLVRLFNERGRSGFRQTVGAWYGEPGSREMLAPLGLIASLLALSAALLVIAGTNQDLAKTDWILEWLYTFPVPIRGLLLARVLETALASPLVWFLLFPFFSVVFWCAGHSWLGIGLGIAATVYVGVLAGSLRVVTETGLRSFLSLRNVSRVQAALSVVSIAVFFSALASSISPDFLETLSVAARRLPRWVLLNPLTLPIGMAAGGARSAVVAAGCASTALLSAACATTFGGWMLRDGITTGAGPHQGTRRRSIATGKGVAHSLGGMAQGELRHLFRDRTMFAQVFITPAILVGMQLLLNRGLLDTVSRSPRHAAAMTFGVAALVLSTGGCRTLVADVPVLWLYCTLPRSLERLLIDKAIFWCGIALAIAFAVLCALAGAHAAFLLSAAPTIAVVVVGVVLYAFIATAIGVLGTDALEIEPNRRIQVSMVYLFMLLATMFGYALYTPSVWAKFVQIVLSSLLAFALWQKVSDHAPFLLDPTEAPPPNIAVADGVIAALAFFVLQGVIVLCLTALDCSLGASLLFAFAGAGFVVASMTLFTFWRTRVPNLLVTLGLRGSEGGLVRALASGVAGGLAGGAVARGYLWVVAHVAFLRNLRDETIGPSPGDKGAMLPWLIVLVVVAAPLFEEFIFRAVLFGGFRRSLGPVRAAVFSALVFAIVHPVIASAPVFVLGLIAALVYQRSRSLLAPIAAHMTYNAAVLLFALG